MDFFKKIFGNKAIDNSLSNNNSNQDNFVVDDKGLAHETDSIKTEIKKETSTEEKTIAKEPHTEAVGDTSAFDELMAQAESSVDSRVPDEPVLDPEFQKARDEIQSEEGIEIIPAE